MPTVDIGMVETRLSRLLDEAASGSEIIIARNGTPVAKLVPLEVPPARGKRVLGRLRGQSKVPDDFDVPLPDDVLDAFKRR